MLTSVTAIGNIDGLSRSVVSWMWSPPVCDRAKFKCSAACLSIFILILNSFSIQELFVFVPLRHLLFCLISSSPRCCFFNNFILMFPIDSLYSANLFWIYCFRMFLLLLSANFACIFLHKFEFRCMQIHPCISKVGETPNRAQLSISVVSPPLTRGDSETTGRHVHPARIPPDKWSHPGKDWVLEQWRWS